MSGLGRPVSPLQFRLRRLHPDWRPAGQEGAEWVAGLLQELPTLAKLPFEPTDASPPVHRWWAVEQGESAASAAARLEDAAIAADFEEHVVWTDGPRAVLDVLRRRGDRYALGRVELRCPPNPAEAR